MRIYDVGLWVFDLLLFIAQKGHLIPRRGYYRYVLMRAMSVPELKLLKNKDLLFDRSCRLPIFSIKVTIFCKFIVRISHQVLSRNA